MSNKSKIEWTERTWNPIVGCSKVSEGCRNCYALRQAASGRLQQFKQYQEVIDFVAVRNYGHVVVHQWNGKTSVVKNAFEKPLHWKKPSMVFVCSMGDLFHESVPFEMIGKIYGIMHHCNWHTFQVLTKRPKRAAEFYEWYRENWLKGFESALDNEYDHVWLGVSAENQAAADERIPLLLQTPAAKRFVSCEPLLEQVDLEWLGGINSLQPDWCGGEGGGTGCPHPLLDWVIVGGESGPKDEIRKMEAEWARSIRDQCVAADVPFFFKQWGHAYGKMSREKPAKLDGKVWHQFPARAGQTSTEE